MKKLIAAIAMLGAMAIPSQAQSNNLFEQQGGAFFGRVTVFPGSHFEISNQGTIIKTFPGTERQVSNGTPGVLCTIGQWANGQHIASGQGQFFQNGVVMLRWTNRNTGGVWSTMDSGWRTYIPK